MKSGYHHGDLCAALIGAGLQLVAERSAEALSLREIARMTGVSPTAVYRHFPDKAALTSALAAEGLSRLAAAQHAAFDAAGGGSAGFAATGRAYVRFALENPGLFRLIFSSPRGSNLLAGNAAPQDAATAFLLANAAEAARKAGGKFAEVTALQAWSTAHGLAMLMLDGQIPSEDALIEATLSG